MRFVARHDDAVTELEVERHGSGYRVRIGERWLSVDFAPAGGFVWSLRMEDGTQYSLIHHRQGNTHEITLAGSTVQVEVIDPLLLKKRGREDEIGGGGVVKALMPGRVVRLLVEQGTAVKKGAGVLILEAMKMENEIQSPSDGTVEQILVSAGETVEAGAELVRIV